jgi:predicted TPR repeat methyltransferase
MLATDAPAPEQVAREGLRVALGLHQQGRLADAERIYDALLGHDPRDANAMHFLGVLKHQRGHVDDALALIRASIDIDAQVAAWHNNLGNVLLSSGEPEQAARAYARCSELDPGNVQVLNNLGVLLRQTGRSEEAEARFKQAVQRDPSFVDAHSNLATLYSLRGDVELAFDAFARALELRPGHAQSRRLLGAVYAQLGRLEDAARVYREWLEHEPGSVQARHHLAAVGGEPAPERASDDYVAEVFDAFADSFDQRLGALEYRAPALIASALRQRLGDPPALLDVLDAGCGTGLCANGLLPYARRLVGVDLSASMLSRAAARDQYDELVHAELTAFIAGRPAACYLIVTGDTLC